MSTELVHASSGFDLAVIEPFAALADRICRTEFVPTALRGKPEATLAAMLTGEELGIKPMTALQKIHVIEGRPGLAAELMRALIISRGHEIWIEEKTTTRVTLCGKRKGSERISKVTWTADDIKRAGLNNRPNHQKFPRAMLTARATAELARDVFPDVIGGLYAIEELEDGFEFGEQAETVEIGGEEATTHKRSAAAPKKAATAKAAAPRASRSTAVKEQPPEPDIIDVNEAGPSNVELTDMTPEIAKLSAEQQDALTTWAKANLKMAVHGTPKAMNPTGAEKVRAKIKELTEDPNVAAIKTAEDDVSHESGESSAAEQEDQASSTPDAPTDAATSVGPSAQPLADDDFTITALRKAFDSLNDENKELAAMEWTKAGLGSIKPGRVTLTNSQTDQADRLMASLVQRQKDEFTLRRKLANARMQQAGIKGDDERHDFVFAATNGETNSTAALTHEQFKAIERDAETLIEGAKK